MSLAIKRGFDIAIALCALVLLSPLLLAIALAIRLGSPGPVIYRAKRVGKDGKLFDMYKFRTMVDGDGPKVTARDDPRITPIGRVLRTTKLNELPQLINVLRGEMSMVGPRPEDPEFVAHYTGAERELLSVRPGITSPASIVYYDEEGMLDYSTAARSYLSQIMPTKLRLDLLYVRHRSFLVDLDVLVRTAVSAIPLFREAAPDVEEILLGPVQRLVRRHIAWFVQDFVIAFAAVVVSGVLWRTQMVFDVGVWPSILAAFELALVFSAFNLLFGVQRTAWNYASLTDAIELGLSAALATGAIIAGRYVYVVPALPARMLITAGLLALFGFVVARYRTRLAQSLDHRWAQIRGGYSGRERVLVLGGGEAGRLMVWTLQNSARGQAFDVVGIVDDDLQLRGTRIHNVRVLGSRKDIAEIVAAYDIGLIVFTIHNIAPAEQEAILTICRGTPARIVVLPDLLALLGGLAPSAAAPAPVSRATVACWLEELAALQAAGRGDELARRLAELQAAMGAPADRR